MDEKLDPWWKWCRLCAKEDSENNINVSSCVDIKTAIGKYFWVNIKSKDPTQHICQDCYRLVNQLVSFTERVNKVQAMLLTLQNAKNSERINPNELRSLYDLLDEDFVHMAKGNYVKEENNGVILKNNTENDTHSMEENDGEDKPCDKDTKQSQEITPNERFGVAAESSEDEEVDTAEDCEMDSAENDFEPMDSNQNESVFIFDSEDQGQLIIKLGDQFSVAKDATEPIEEPSKTLEVINSADLLEDYSKYVCRVCGRNYKNAKSYRKHLESHNIEPDLPNFICDKCNKIFPTVRQLIAHNRVHLPLEKKLVIPCPHCDKKFTMESVMKQHVSIVHFNKNPYVCDECGASLKTFASFNDHKIGHSNNYPYECEICKKKFKHKPRLKNHMDTHTETTYDCTQCGVRLNTKRTLKMHMLVHSEEKAYKCNFCDAEFKRGKALKNHLILHIGLRPYKCNFCAKTFSNGSNCRSHKKKFHPAELAAEEAAGLKTEPTNIPKISELRASNNIKRATAISRKKGGLAPEMRALLIAAEQRSKSNSVQKENDKCNQEKIVESFRLEDGSEELHLVLESSDDGGRESLDRCDDSEETVVYKLVKDSKS